MAKIMKYQEFVDKAADKSYQPLVKRFKELSGLSLTGVDKKATYLIEITFVIENIILEHEIIIQFQNTKNRFYKHPEETHPPVKTHYHVVPLNGKKEIYAVNTDGTAHHKKNRGYEIPRKEADELRLLGVSIKSTNIIESIDNLENSDKIILTESIKSKCVSIFIEIEE